MTPRAYVYDGRDQIGSISIDVAAFTAFNLTGDKLGTFKTRSEAVRAVLNASRAAKIGGAS